MNASTSADFSMSRSTPAAQGSSLSSTRRRINSQASRALEKLSHAIGYLTDEFVQGNGSPSEHNELLGAVQLLMAANREVYFDCPEIPSLGDRFRLFLYRRAA